MTIKKQALACCIGLSLFSSTALSADFGVRLGMERAKHECKFSNNSDFTTAAGGILDGFAEFIELEAGDVAFGGDGTAIVNGTNKTSGCSEKDKPTIGIFMKNKIADKTFIETELAYVQKREFNSVYDVNVALTDVDVDDAGGEFDGDGQNFDVTLGPNTQKLKVKSFPRLLLSIGHDFDTGNNFTITPVVGIGYAQIKASGDQNSGQFIMREKTNNNFIWNIGASFSIPKSSWSVDYRYIDYGKVETQATQHPSADAGSEKLHGKMTSHTVSLSYLF
jgi:opacity protein-like surface antigen